jgi:hypothetical protein
VTTVKRLIVTAILVLASFSIFSPANAGDDSGCSSGSDGYTVHTTCIKSGSETNAYITSHSDHNYTIRPACEVGGLALCDQPGTCNIEGHDGNLFDVYQDDSPDPLDWQACLTDQEAKHLGGLTPGAVQHAFESLAWPASPLVVQPPDGKTLVNFDTT